MHRIHMGDRHAGDIGLSHTKCFYVYLEFSPSYTYDIVYQIMITYHHVAVISAEPYDKMLLSVRQNNV